MRRALRFAPRPLSVKEAYALWAPTYGDEPDNPLMRIEQDAVLALLPPVGGGTVLDVGCGSGRYLKRLTAEGSRSAIGLDLSTAMLRRSRSFTPLVVGGDMATLPFPGAHFDLVVCSLAVGHVRFLEAAVGEIARVLRPGGVVVYSDMHPDGSRRGWKRTFTAPSGRVCEAPHHPHERESHLAACAAAGLRVDHVAEPVVDFEHPERGLPAVIVLRATRVEAGSAR